MASQPDLMKHGRLQAEPSLSLLANRSREQVALPHLDLLWHYDCVVSPRSSALAAKLLVDSSSPRSPFHLSDLLSPLSSASSVLSSTIPSSPLSRVDSGSLHDAINVVKTMDVGGSVHDAIDVAIAMDVGDAIETVNPDDAAAIETGNRDDAAPIETVTVNDAADASSPCSFASSVERASSPFSYAAQHVLDNRHMALQRVFCTFDADGDGYVSVQELCSIFDKLGIHKTPEAIQTLMMAGSLGNPASDHICEEEFCLLYDSACGFADELRADTSSSSEDVHVDVDEDLKATFSLFDMDGNGLISPEELQCVLCSLGFEQACEFDFCIEMIARVDENGDGHVDFSEFKRMMSFTV